MLFTALRSPITLHSIHTSMRLFGHSNNRNFVIFLSTIIIDKNAHFIKQIDISKFPHKSIIHSHKGIKFHCFLSMILLSNSLFIKFFYVRCSVSVVNKLKASECTWNLLNSYVKIWCINNISLTYDQQFIKSGYFHIE